MYHACSTEADYEPIDRDVCACATHTSAAMDDQGCVGRSLDRTNHLAEVEEFARCQRHTVIRPRVVLEVMNDARFLLALKYNTPTTCTQISKES